jgi:geranylgeranyl pyrophosphate synthase
MPLPETIVAALDRWAEPIMQTVALAAPRSSAPGTGDLNDMVWYQLDSGGKRIRPLIVLLATEALGGSPDSALPFAAGVELLHNATLVHDDFQDGDTVRRGNPTLWQRYGWEQSINAGDGLYFAGLSLIAQTAIPDGDLRRLLATVAQRMSQVIAGQVNEFRLKDASLQGTSDREQAYIDVIRGKTAGLFALPLEGAGICAGLDDSAVSQLSAVGDTMGLLFQVQDDLLDLVGDKGRGQVGADIAEGKPSLPVVHCLAHAAADVAGTLAAIVNKPRSETTADDITTAIGLLESSGSIEYALSRVRAWRTEVRSEHPAIDALLRDMTTAILEPIAHRL